MKIIGFIADHITDITAALFIIAAITVLVYLASKKKLGAVLYGLLTKAETENPGGTGEYKFAEVLSSLYSYLPSWLRIVIPERVISAWIESALQEAKKTWEENGTLEKLREKE